MNDVFIKLLPYEEIWCKLMGYFNPYIDGFSTHLTKSMPTHDMACYKRYPRYSFVYDKLWIIKSQGLQGGRLEKLFKKNITNIKYPIFIKPRWGHLNAGSKNCFKIISPDEISKFIDYKNMIWSEFIDAKEGMTDYVLLNGNIVHQITYIYSEKQNGFSDDWKYISPESTPPFNITEWVNQHMKDFTGIVNVQYRDTIIIEVGLRLARGGAYLLSTENAPLINNINSIFDNKTWNYNLSHEMKFKPFYVFKCFTEIPIVFLYPQKLINWYIRKKTTYPFYEYYFEPVGSSGMVFFQFMNDDFNRGMQTKKNIENIFSKTQIIMFILFFIMLFLIIFTKWKYNYIIVIAVLLIWLVRIFNPITANYICYMAQKQLFFNNDSIEDINNDIETFDT